MTRHFNPLFLAIIVSTGLPLACRAQQIPFSQHGEVMQRVGFTDIGIRYSRPVARGREVFGGVVQWGRIWNPGADSATTVSFSRDVTVNGHALDAGRYTLWIVPAEDASWTVIFSRAVDIFHTPYPGADHDAVRLQVQPEQGAHMEVLAYYFPVVTGDTTVLRMHWGETMIALAIQAPWRP